MSEPARLSDVPLALRPIVALAYGLTRVLCALGWEYERAGRRASAVVSYVIVYGLAFALLGGAVAFVLLT